MNKAPRNKNWSLSALERRILLAGDVGGAVAPIAAADVGSPIAAMDSSISVASQECRSIVFIDSGVQDASALMSEVPHDADLVLVDSSRDGLQQITDALRSRQNVSAIHIVSHGEAGQIQLGNGVVDVRTLQSHDTMLKSWSASLRHDADILLYGCETGQGAIGHQFVSTLARLTGTDVAASADLTGNADQGGDWILETTFGNIENAIVFDANARKSLMHTLDIVINAWGQTGEEQFRLLIDGQEVQSYHAATTWTPFVYETNQSLTGDQVQIEFTNDAYDPANNFDRNLFVNNIQVNGQNYETDSVDTFSTGTWTSQDGIVSGYGRGRILHVNGIFQYGTSDPPTGGSTIVVNAAGDEATEQFVLIAGSETFEATTVTTDLQSYTFQTENVVDASAIRIEFINDQYDPGAGIDSNLIVDNVVLDGAVWETESPQVFANGVWDPANERLDGGFFETEVLNGNGYFQFASDVSETGLYQLEASFGQDGVQEAGAGFGRADLAVSSSDGKFAFVTYEVVQDGQVFTTTENLQVHLANGAVDTGFSGDGVLDIAPIVDSFFADEPRTVASESVAFDSQGRIVVVGRAFFGSGFSRYDEGFLLRINPDGTLDQTFTANGSNNEFSFYDTSHILIDSSDRIVLGDAAGLVRLTVDGTRDTTFGTNGRVDFTSNVPGFDPSLNQLLLKGDSIYALAGRPQFENPSSAAVIKLSADTGDFDIGYGSGGYTLIPEATFDESASFREAYEDAVVDDQGRVVVAGRLSMRRVTADGEIDTSFADNGILILPENVISEGSEAFVELGELAIDSQGRIVSTLFDFVVRVNDDGSLDTSLSDDGFQRLDITAEPGYVYGGLSHIVTAGNDIIGLGRRAATTILVKFRQV